MRLLASKDKEAPDIPPRLLQMHEEGKVVFFCGAGISYPATLPGFKDLTDYVYNELGVFESSRSRMQKKALKTRHYDVAFTLLESFIHDGPRRVREKIAERLLKPIINNDIATSMHQSLLTLSKTRADKIHLVTTNVDRIFEHVIKNKGLNIPTHVAPSLPLVNSRMNGLIYLHGLLSEDAKNGENESLIFSSGDFGRAYLMDRWASRFLEELFKNYCVCFIGYSLEDPIVRYMSDAIAAERLSGENPPEMFAFCGYKAKNREHIEEEWRAKQVTPISYNQSYNHSLLRNTLREWSRIYEEGWQGKKSIIQLMINTKPSYYTQDNNDISKMIWALSDPSGKPAEFFAHANPVFSLEWLDVFNNHTFHTSEMVLFGIPLERASVMKRDFSLLKRPFPDTSSPIMSLVGNSNLSTQNDKILSHLITWLIRHLNNPALIIWISNHGGVYNIEFQQHIINRIDSICLLEKQEKFDELEEIKKDSPDGIPNATMRKLWNLVLSHKIESSRDALLLYQYADYVELYGIDSSIKGLLLKGLSPKVSLKEPLRIFHNRESINPVKHISKMIDAEVYVDTDVEIFISNVKYSKTWIESLPSIIMDITLLLKEALDLEKIIGQAYEDSDFSYIYKNSIAEDQKPASSHNWLILADLARDAWKELYNSNKNYAMYMLLFWWEYTYPLFKRLVFFCATIQADIDINQIIRWFTSQNTKWLWSLETQYEVLQLLKKIADKCPKSDCERIESIVLDGMPVTFFNEGVSDIKKTEHIDRSMWLRLSTMRKAKNSSLGEASELTLIELSKKYAWELQENGEDEYPVRMTVDYDEEITPLPRNKNDLYDFIANNQQRTFWPSDDWKALCIDEMDMVVTVLTELTEEGIQATSWWDTCI